MIEKEITYTPQSTKKDREVSKMFSPDIGKEKCVSLTVDSKTTVYIPHWKIQKYGLDFYKKKYAK